MDRVRKRKKAQALIETAQRLRAEKRVEVYIISAEAVPRSLDGLGPDELLAIAGRLQEAG